LVNAVLYALPSIITVIIIIIIVIISIEPTILFLGIYLREVKAYAFTRTCTFWETGSSHVVQAALASYVVGIKSMCYHAWKLYS
jgi:hypothetical protein